MINQPSNVFQSNQMHSSVGKSDYWQSLQQKKYQEQTINSDEQSVESYMEFQPPQPQQASNLTLEFKEEKQNSEEQSQQFEYTYQKQNYTYNQVAPQEVLATDQQDDNQFMVYQPPPSQTNNEFQLNSVISQPRNSILPYKQQPKKLIPFQPEKKASMSVSVASYMPGYKKSTKSQKQVFAFHYDRIGDQQSKLYLDDVKNPFYFIMSETLGPLLTVFLIEVIILIVQDNVGQYCFIKEIECSNYGVRLWSFIKQMLLFKLGFIFCQGHIIYQLTLTNQLVKHKHRRPLMEYALLITFVVATDFLMIFWVGVNEDWIFMIYLYVVSFVVFFNTFRMKTWPRLVLKGFSYFAYVPCILCLLAYVFWVLPAIRNRLEKHSVVAAPEYYMFIYPFLDLAMEIFIDSFLSMTKHSELLIYQAQLIIIATRAGTLTIGSMTRFDYWFCLFFLVIFRINNASLIFTVFIRRFIYYAMPESLRSLVSMEETNLTLKGKHGAYYEHLVWIAYFYLLCISGKSATSYVGDEIKIENGSFDLSDWKNYERWKYQPIIVWFFLLVPEIIGSILNRKKCYDNIKMLGGHKLRFYENVATRMVGFYLFNFALVSNLI